MKILDLSAGQLEEEDDLPLLSPSQVPKLKISLGASSSHIVKEEVSDSYREKEAIGTSKYDDSGVSGATPTPNAPDVNPAPIVTTSRWVGVRVPAIGLAFWKRTMSQTMWHLLNQWWYSNPWSCARQLDIILLRQSSVVALESQNRCFLRMTTLLYPWEKDQPKANQPKKPVAIEHPLVDSNWGHQHRVVSILDHLALAKGSGHLLAWQQWRNLLRLLLVRLTQVFKNQKSALISKGRDTRYSELGQKILTNFRARKKNFEFLNFQRIFRSSNVCRNPKSIA